MGRYAVGLLVCLLALATTFCKSDTASRGDSGGQDVANDATVDVGFDLSVPDLLPTDTASDSTSDSGGDSAQTDADPSLRVDFEPPVTHCDRSGFYGGTLNLTVHWTTTLATVCEMTVSIAGGPDQPFATGEVVPIWSHEVEYPLSMLSGWSDPPQVGDSVAWGVRCTAENGTTVGAQQTFELRRGQLQCIWPFDDACSDDTLVMCNRPLATCAEPFVPAVIDGCPRCVHPVTCSCDDGTEVTCDEDPPDCAPQEVAAIREGCYECVESWSCLPAGEYACPTYVAALSDCAYRWTTPVIADICPWTECMDEPCQNDDDCPLMDSRDVGGECVTGNCVYCWENAQCSRSEVCRGGRCVGAEAPTCPEASDCADGGCHTVTPSETPCDVCVCDSWFGLACSADTDCQVISSHQYAACVYGRCADCRNDDDCEHGVCLPPGICHDMTPHPEALYGTWLVGWSGGMNHFSYIRFEPDGTLRRGRYEEQVAWSDDFPSLPCVPEGGFEFPLLGTWEPEITASGQPIIRMSLNVACDAGDGWTARMVVAFANDMESASFDEVDSDWTWEAYRMSTDSCTPDFSLCELPDY